MTAVFNPHATYHIPLDKGGIAQQLGGRLAVIAWKSRGMKAVDREKGMYQQ
jgi:hypothetical protein